MMYLGFFLIFFAVGFIFDSADNTLLSSVEIPTEITFDSLKDSYFVDAGFDERLDNLINSLFEITTWFMILATFFGAYVIFWFFDKPDYTKTAIAGSVACAIMFLGYLIGFNIFEFNIWFKSSSILVALLNFVAIGKFVGLVYYKYGK